MKLSASVISPASGRNCWSVDFIVFMERYLIRIKKTFQRLSVNHVLPAGSPEITVAFNFISERTVLNDCHQHEL
jgi:hypothetical protein